MITICNSTGSAWQKAMSFAVLSAMLPGCLLGLHIPKGHATSGPGCLFVVNVASWDVLNMRAQASAQAPVVDQLRPQSHGIIHLDAPCVPSTRLWSARWCPVTHYSGEGVTSGWVKARYVRDSDCP
ncbi:SH3 domain-containing protein [uncultured Cohaesibacter sp.]|uniref:SH3 domain-containing protein n=1 Tax=uncultured Cohaesibacter sp. TaxID=1002546 RepID=UPI00292EB755|nr:SH3 domain-containing protein [uncultured Cohaesibacter sp.]